MFKLHIRANKLFFHFLPVIGWFVRVGLQLGAKDAKNITNKGQIKLQKRRETTLKYMYAHNAQFTSMQQIQII